MESVCLFVFVFLKNLSPAALTRVAERGSEGHVTATTGQVQRVGHTTSLTALI